MSTIEGIQQLGFAKSRAGSDYFSTYNPVDQKSTGWQFAESTEQEIEQAVEKAREAFPVFSKLSAEQRAAFIETIADELGAYYCLTRERYLVKRFERWIPYTETQLRRSR